MLYRARESPRVDSRVRRRPRSDCENSPRAIFAAFAGAARQTHPADKDEALAIGYLFFLQRMLQQYRIDRPQHPSLGRRMSVLKSTPSPS